jgi:1,4-dihydroxy-2-naphthoyl-CoA hydrolase
MKARAELRPKNMGNTVGTYARDLIHKGLDALLNFHCIEASRDTVVIEYQVEEKHLQPFGIVHGGVHCAVIETACSIGAGIVAMQRGQSVVGIDNHTSFVRAVRTGRLRVTATPVTRGRRSQLWEATARNESDQIVSTGRVRLLCLDAGSDLAGEAVEPYEQS